MKNTLQQVCLVLLLTAFFNAYAGSCFQEQPDINDCKIKAQQGNADAQYTLALAYDSGKIIPKNHEKAAKWYLKAAEQDNTLAQYNLSNMYSKGHGVPQNSMQAAKWMSKAAEQGLGYAQFFIARICEVSTPPLYKAAAKWYRKAAEQEYPDAQYNLGVLYLKGQGVPQDYVMAHMYFNLAAIHGDKGALKAKNIVEKNMSSSQLEKSQDLAREWTIRH